jgi:hypothetical protein
MVDLVEVTDELLAEWEALDRTYWLFLKFRKGWEADPFEEPNAIDFLAQAGEHGGPEERGRLSGMLDLYMQIAPEPAYTEAQEEERRAHVRRLFNQKEEDKG